MRDRESVSSPGMRKSLRMSLAMVGSLLLLAAVSAAICIPTPYTVTSSAPPPLANWTDTSGALWSPAGGFPGCAPGDSAADLNVSPTTVIVNSSIPNPIIGLNWNCSGCAIDLQPGGQLTIAGPATIGNGASLQISGGLLVITSGGSLTLQPGSNLVVTGGGTLAVQSGGSATLGGTSTIASASSLNVNAATVTLNSALTVQSGGLVSLNGATISGAGALNNAGTVDQNGLTSTISAPFNNQAGAAGVTVSSGRLTLNGGGNGDAPFAISGTLDFPAGTYTMGTGGTVAGSGTLSVSGGTLSIGGVTSPTNFTMDAGTLTGGGFLSIPGTFTWQGGTISGTGGTEIAGTGTGMFTGGSGTMSLDGRTFNDYGAVYFSATTNPLELSNGATFGVYGTFDFQDDGSVTCNCAVPSSFLISPNGVVVKSGGAGTSSITPPTTNDSQIYVMSGTLELAGNGTHNGLFYAASGATLRFAASSTWLTSSSSLFTDGNVDFATGSVDIDSWPDVYGVFSVSGGFVSAWAGGATTDFSLTAGELFVDDLFSVYGNGTWSQGAISGGAGPFKVESGATLLLDAATCVPTLAGVELINDGTITYTPTLVSTNHLELDGATLTNNGTFDMQADAPITEATIVAVQTASGCRARATRRRGQQIRSDALFLGSGIVNTGTWKKTGAGTSTIEPAFANSGSVLAQAGTLDFGGGFTQSGGNTTLGAGDVSSPLTMQFGGGTLDGAGTVTADVQNDAGVNPGSGATTGVITITGNYTQGSTGSLTIDLAGPAAGQFDQVNVSGAVTLDGAFTATLVNPYVPTNGTTFPVLAFASRSGAFATETLPSLITSSYTPTSFVLTAVNPSADLSAAMGGPATVNAGAALSYTVTITNQGPNASAGTITVADTLPAGATSGSGAGSGWSCGAPAGGVITCTTTATVNATQSLPVLTFTMTAPPGAGPVTNSATVTSSFDGNAANDTASVNTTVIAQTDVSIAKTGPGGVTAGQNIVWTIVVTNNGPSTATGVTVSDPAPPNATFVSNSGACTTAFPCSVGTLTAGQSATITSTWSTSPSFSGNITNTATVTSTTLDPNSTNNSSSATTNVGAQADLQIAKSGPATTGTNQNVTYTITFTNNGPSPATSVVVSDPPPVGIAFVSNSGACTTPFPCSIGTLNAGQSGTITSTYTVPPNYAAPSIANTASIASSVNDPNTANNSATATTVVVSLVDVSITKSGPASVVRGQNITYTITVTNGGSADAPNVTVSDTTPAGLTFVSNSGSCTTAFPCSVGTLTAGQSATITATYAVPAGFVGSSVSNTATVATTAPETNAANNSSSTTASVVSPVADLAITKTGPAGARNFDLIDFTITVTNNGPSPALNVVVSDPPAAGMVFVSNSGACTTLFPCSLGTLNAGQTATITAKYKVASSGGTITNVATVSSSTTDGNTANDSSSATVVTGQVATCPTRGPSLSSPANGAVTTSPVKFTWSGVPNAIGYFLTIDGGGQKTTLNTGDTTAMVPLDPGTYTWSVDAAGAESCGRLPSASATFTVCPSSLSAPVASVIGEMTTGQTLNVSWSSVQGATKYELQEAGEPSFVTPATYVVDGLAMSFTKTAQTPTPFYYRVRAIAACNNTSGPFSPVVTAAVVPVPTPLNTDPNVTVPDGSHTPVTWQIFIPGLPQGTTSFVATVDRPWLSVAPTSGVITPAGLTLTISADPTALTNGTWTGTVIVVYGTTTISGRLASHGGSSYSVPISITLVTPVTPTPMATASATALVVPSVGHLAGFDSQWRSDIRVANLGAQSQKFQLTFNAGSGDPAAMTKQATITVDAGATTALDDVVRSWYGVGSTGNSSNGILTVQALDSAGKPVLTNASAAVSSRTFNAAANGTVGQFIPAVPFAKFNGRTGLTSALSLQQLAQTSSYRTNLGITEAAGKPATVLVSGFDGTGSKLFELPVSLQSGEQKVLNSLFASNGVTSLSNGRVEVRVTGGDGKVTAYASVVDNASHDPILISGTALDGRAANRFVLAGIADVSGGGASWRSDVRIHNAGPSQQTATLTFYPSGNGTPSSVPVTVASGEVRQLDNVLQSSLGVTNAGGTIHVTTSADAPLVVSARTFNQTAEGTLGQFIPAITPGEAVGSGERALQILQVEESPRYRTNIGVAEVHGKAATVEIGVVLPNSKVTPVIQVPLAAFESRQIAVLDTLSLGNTYNARVTVRVIDGGGRVTAYGSVIDNLTKDPTYIPAQ